MTRHFCIPLLLVVAHCNLSQNANAADLSQQVRCTGHLKPVSRVAISPNGSIAASGGNESVLRLWNTSSGKEIASITLRDLTNAKTGLDAMAFSPSGQELAVAAHGNSVRYYEVPSGKELLTAISVPLENAAYDVAYSPDGSQLAIADGKTVKVWDVRRGKIVREFRFTRSERVGRVSRVSFSPDGRLLAAALQDSGGRAMKKVPRMRVWELASGATLFDVTEDNGADQAVSFAADGRLLAEASKGYPGRTHVWSEFPGAVHVWDVKSKQLRYRVPADKVVTKCAAFSPDGRVLVTGGNDPEIKLWNADDGSAIGTLAGHVGSIRDLAFSRDGTKMASVGTDDVVLIWPMDDR